MFSKFKTYWHYGGTYCCVELHSKDGQDVYKAVNARRTKNEFNDFTFIDSRSLSELTNEIRKNQHCWLLINSDKILIKEIPRVEEVNKAVTSAYPGLSLTEFYFQVYQTRLKSYVVVSRKEYVDAVLKKAEEGNIHILGFQLGFFTISNILPLVNNSDIVIPGYRINVDENEISSFDCVEQTKEINYIIEDTEVSSNFLVPLSGILNYIKSQDLLSNFSGLNHKLISLYNQNNFFRKGSHLAMGIILVSLLVNFFIFQSYYKQLQTVRQEVQLNEAQKTNYQNRSLELKKKEQMIENLLTTGHSKSSFYINRIASKKPPSILFSAIEYQPLQRAIRLDKSIEYKENELSIIGESSNKTSFSNWMEELEEIEWIDGIEIINYGISDNTISSFEIRMENKAMMIPKYKNILLIVGFVLTIVIAFRLAYSKTIETRKELISTESKLLDLENINRLSSNLDQREKLVDSVFNSNNIRNTSIQNNLLEYLNTQSAESGLIIVSFTQPHTIIEEDMLKTSYQFTIKGSFSSLINVVYALEQEYNLGNITHVHFDKKREYRNRSDFLTCFVILESLVSE